MIMVQINRAPIGAAGTQDPLGVGTEAASLDTAPRAATRGPDIGATNISTIPRGRQLLAQAVTRRAGGAVETEVGTEHIRAGGAGTTTAAAVVDIVGAATGTIIPTTTPMGPPWARPSMIATRETTVAVVAWAETTSTPVLRLVAGDPCSSSGTCLLESRRGAASHPWPISA